MNTLNVLYFKEQIDIHDDFQFYIGNNTVASVSDLSLSLLYFHNFEFLNRDIAFIIVIDLFDWISFDFFLFWFLLKQKRLLSFWLLRWKTDKKFEKNNGLFYYWFAMPWKPIVFAYTSTKYSEQKKFAEKLLGLQPMLKDFFNNRGKRLILKSL